MGCLSGLAQSCLWEAAPAADCQSPQALNTLLLQAVEAVAMVYTLMMVHTINLEQAVVVAQVAISLHRVLR
jgi:hypothetical protein